MSDSSEATCSIKVGAVVVIQCALIVKAAAQLRLAVIFVPKEGIEADEFFGSVLDACIGAVIGVVFDK